MRISRKDKKKLRAIALCYTGNPECRKSKYSKKQWISQRNDFHVWLRVFNFSERRTANTIK